jgi:D-alanine-D-alanine ligase-like ATP-grasp enzyme
MTARPRALLVYQRVSLPWIFDAAVRAGVDLVLVPRPDEGVPAVRPPGVAEVVALDVFADPPAALARVEELHRRAPLDGVLTLFDGAVPFVALVAERLGLPGLGVEAALAARDKRVMRERFAEAGVPSPAAVRVDRLDAPGALGAAMALRPPLVVKPAGGYSSHAVTRVDTLDDLGATARGVWDLMSGEFASVVSADGLAGLVIEEYVGGLELAVDALAVDGRVAVLAVGEKGRPEGPYFEETTHRAPAQLDAGTLRRVHDAVVAATLSLGVRWGPSHTELRLDRDSQPRVLEVGARIGGSGVCHHIVAASRGIDYAGLVLRQCVGEDVALPEVGRDPEHAGACYIIPCGGDGVIARVDGLDEVRAHPACDLLVQFMHAGDVIEGYPMFSGYPGFVLSHHPDTSDAERFHRWLEGTVGVRFAPPDPAYGVGQPWTPADPPR